jgi:hypothetical protein
MALCAIGTQLGQKRLLEPEPNKVIDKITYISALPQVIAA